MAFLNRIRLPFRLTRPQFPTERNIFRKADGSSVVQSILMRKTYELETDYLPEKWHERLAVALAHDTVNIEGDKYFGNVVQSGDYTIDWSLFLNYPTAKAKSEMQVTPFDASNTNCQTCEDAQSLDLVDDTFYSPLNENTTYTINVITNDKICCYPAVFSITSFNTDFLSSCSIDQSGIVTLHTKTGLPLANGIDLFKYRVTCENGHYDEADGFANINGTVPACLAPFILSSSGVTSTGIIYQVVIPSPAPDHLFWRVEAAANPSVTVQSGTVPGPLIASTTTNVAVGGLTPGTDYNFFIRSQCDPSNDDSSASNYVTSAFTTTPTGEGANNCGNYRIAYSNPNDAGPSQGGHVNISYTDCNGTIQTVYVPNFVTRAVCAMQTTPGNPVDLSSHGNPWVTITYIGLCS